MGCDSVYNRFLLTQCWQTKAQRSAICRYPLHAAPKLTLVTTLQAIPSAV